MDATLKRTSVEKHTQEWLLLSLSKLRNTQHRTLTDISFLRFTCYIHIRKTRHWT